MGCRPCVCAVIALALLHAHAQYDLVHPASPCPGVFSYEDKQADRDKWFGVVLISTEEVLTGLRLDITLDRPADLLGVSRAQVSECTFQ